MPSLVLESIRRATRARSRAFSRTSGSILRAFRAHRSDGKGLAVARDLRWPVACRLARSVACVARGDAEGPIWEAVICRPENLETRVYTIATKGSWNGKRVIFPCPTSRRISLVPWEVHTWSDGNTRLYEHSSSSVRPRNGKPTAIICTARKDRGAVGLPQQAQSDRAGSLRSRRGSPGNSGAIASRRSSV